MKKTPIDTKEKDAQISKMLDIRHSFNSNAKGIKKFVSHLKPVVEEADKCDSEEVIKALKLAHKESGIEFPTTKEDSEKLWIYRLN